MRKLPRIHYSCRILSIAFCLFISGTGNAVAYGGYHYGYGHGYHHYDHHSHYGFHASYHSHDDIGTGGYIVLGLIGAVLLTHILNNDNDRYQGTYHRSYAYQTPVTYSRIVQPVKQKPVYTFRSNEGWDALLNGNAKLALDIFAVQSQQNLDSGIPKAGFALAAAASGELDRGARTMRKAIQIDPAALNIIPINNELELTIDLLTEEYESTLQYKQINTDNSFMVAALSYLKQDYATARNMIAVSDHSQSANNLRKMINEMTGVVN